MKKNNNILYLSYDGMTDSLGQSQVLPYLKGLAAMNSFKITLISCEKPAEYEKSRIIIENICAKSSIDWQPVFYTKRPPVLSTLYDIYKLRKLAARLHKQKQFKIVHCRSYIAALVGQWMKRRFGTKFIFDMRGFWADERVDGNLWPQNNALYKNIYKVFKKKEKEFLEEADHTISLTQCAKTEIHSWGRLIENNPVNIQVIPCCVDLEHFDAAKIQPAESDKLRKSLKIAADSFVLLYLGAVGTWYMLPEMLDLFKVLQKHIPQARFLFVTAEDPEYIRRAAKAKNIAEEALIVTRASRAEVPLYLSLANASVFFIKPAYSKKASSPTKQGELMAMGIPVICNAGVGDTDYVVEKYQSGISISDFNERHYEQAIWQLMAMQNIDKNAIRSGAADYFSLEEGIALYEQVYHSVLKSK